MQNQSTNITYKMAEEERGVDLSKRKFAYKKPVGDEFEDRMPIALKKEDTLRYGENPNQPAAVYHLFNPHNEVYRESKFSFGLIKEGKGGLSATNYMDIGRAMNLLKYFKHPSVAAMKHLVPSGLALQDFSTQQDQNSLVDIYERARNADARSAFGSVVASNVPIDIDTAEEIMNPGNYVEVVAAPSFDEGTMAFFEKRRDIRVVTFTGLEKLPKFVGDDTEDYFEIKEVLADKIILQKPYLTSIRCVEDLINDPMIVDKEKKRHIVQRDPTPQEAEDALTAWYVNIGTRSNGIVIVKNGVTRSIGSGQQERVGAVEQAIVKGYQKSMDREGYKYDPLMGINVNSYKSTTRPLEGAVMSSDAFFPFRDSVDLAARVGISAIVQPFGSIKDSKVIDAANEHGMAMMASDFRCFRHF